MNDKNLEILEQNEIDDLFGDETDLSDDNKGIKTFIEKSLDSVKNLPMLELIYAKYINSFSKNLTTFSDCPTDISINSISALRFNNYINSIPVPGLVIIFKAREWNTYGLIIPNNSLLFILIDILLGGKKHSQSIKIEGRPYTNIEKSVAKKFAEIILDNLSSSFSSLTDVKFLFDKIETDPRFVTIARKEDSAVLAKFDIVIGDNSGSFEILFPQASLDPIRDLLSKKILVNDDIEWEHSLKEKIMEVELPIKLVAKSPIYKMKDLKDFKVGNTIIMKNSIDNIEALIEDHNIFRGKLGSLDDKLAALIEEINL